ncbi:unnamed protein product [Effrenium voratum]|nr:unnamed protein product [Effrenium voratum]
MNARALASSLAICIETSWRWNCCGARTQSFLPAQRLSPFEQCGELFESLEHGARVTASPCNESHLPSRLGVTEEASASGWSEGSEGILNVLLQPRADPQAACEVLTERAKALEVLLLYQEGLYEWLPPFRWLLAEVLPAMKVPLHLRQFKVSNATKPEALPVYAAALVVVVAYHKVNHFDFAAYAAYARTRGADLLGLLHLGHEVQWETNDQAEDLLSWGTRRADGARARRKRDLAHYFEDYRQFDFVLRQHFSLAYANSSLYLPLGPGWGWVLKPRRLLKASRRTNLCLTALWRPLDFEYHWDRGELLELLTKDTRLCNITGKWVTAYDEQLMNSALSLCPFGSSPETYRLWESVLSGAVVVMTRATFVTAMRAPFILLNSWHELPSLLQKLRSRPDLLDQLQEQQSKWFNAYMQSLRHQLKALGNLVLPSLGLSSREPLGKGHGARGDGDSDHAATVLLHEEDQLQAVQLTERDARRAPDLCEQRRARSADGGSSQLSQLLTGCINILRHMKEAQVEADDISRNALAFACAWPLALDLAASDAVGLGTKVAACEATAQWQLTLELLRSSAQRRVLPNRIVCNAAITVCGSCSRWQHALALLRAMDGRRLRAEVADFNASMQALGGEAWGRCLRLLEEVLQRRLLPSSVTLQTAVSVCQGEWRRALQLAESSPFPSASAPSEAPWPWQLAMLDEMRAGAGQELGPARRSAFAKSWRRAVASLQGETTVGFNAALAACRQRGKWQAGLQLFNAMRCVALEPSDITFLTAISICEAAPHISDQWPTALEFLSFRTERFGTADSGAFNSAINACEKAGQWQAALWLLASMEAARLADEISYNAGISACSKGSQWETALALLATMPYVEIQPTVITLNSATTACEKAGCWQHALALLLAAGSLADAVSWSAAISACEKAGQWLQALELLAAMTVSPNVITHNAAISACEKGRQWPRALHLLVAMRSAGCPQDHISFCAAVSACEKTGQWCQILSAVSSMQARSFSPNRIIHNAAVGACEKGPIPAYLKGFHRSVNRSDLTM